MPLNIFLTGATGYIGGAILEGLLRHPDASNFAITTIVRNRGKAETLKKEFGVNVVVGSHSDASLVEPLAEKADVTITAADVDDLDACKAILKGIRHKFEKIGKPPLLIHTSGTAVLADNAKGEHGNATIYSDANADQIETLSASQPHREVDLAVIGADREGYVKAWIVIPSTIYGIAKGRLPDAGICNPRSQQIRNIIKGGLKRGTPFSVGKGANYWPNVHIDDLVDLYVLLFDKIRSADPPPSGREGIYFGANGEHNLSDIYKHVAVALKKQGRSNTDEPTPLTDDEAVKHFGGKEYVDMSFGSNSRARADRGYALGWKPKYKNEDMLASISEETTETIKEYDAEKGRQ